MIKTKAKFSNSKSSSILRTQKYISF